MWYFIYVPRDAAAVNIGVEGGLLSRTCPSIGTDVSELQERKPHCSRIHSSNLNLRKLCLYDSSAGQAKGACMVSDTGPAALASLHDRMRSSKLELAYLQLWLLTHLQSNLFVAVIPARRRAERKFRRGYISSPSSSAHQSASRGQFDSGTLRCSSRSLAWPVCHHLQR